MRLVPDTDQSGYQPLDGNVPAFVADAHPDGVHVALITLGRPDNRGAVWDRRSGRLVWAPAATQALCWLRDGEIVLIRDGDAHPLEGTPASAAGAAWPARGPFPAWRPRFLCERRSWPDLRFLSVCPVDSQDANWCGGAVASPRGDLVAVVWLEQHAAGVELVEVRPQGDRQLVGAGYAVEPNYVSGPAFSPDGRYLVLGCGRFAWWNRGDEYGDEDPELPSPGGHFLVGHMLVRDLDRGSQREIPVEVDLSEGWLPPEDDEHDEAETHPDQPIGDPGFVSDTEFTVALLTGETRRLSVDAR